MHIINYTTKVDNFYFIWGIRIIFGLWYLRISKINNQNMTSFSGFLQLGIDHILDTQGYDHILFVIVLSAIYPMKDWKKIVILVTAFTIGHSLTLALSATGLLKINAGLVETLIPITIMVTGLLNVYKIYTGTLYEGKILLNYILASCFGLIHGLGFSNYFKAILGQEASILQPLLAFNLGVELGQIFIVIGAVAISTLFIEMVRIPAKYWAAFISILAIIIAGTLLIG